MQLLRLR
ncbi:unnamed protein product [Linum tenue]|nr:unnamed protein product [Linum tenue]CAI0547332.1 unnamed protein product [Linum tenue]